MSRYIRVVLAALLIVSGVLIFLPSGYVSAGGIVLNAGFEKGEGEIPSNWNLTGNATRVDTGPVYAGNWSARITGSNDTLTQWLWVGNITWPVTYDAWGWIYVSGNVTGAIALDFWAGKEGTQLSPTTQLSATDTNGYYVQGTSTIQAPPGTTYVRIRLLGTGWHEGAEVRFDEIGFYPPMGGYCFIATAAYGTGTASQLDILRDFRDQVLLKNALGSQFVAAYYRLSPPVANFIATNDFLRTVVRETLIDPLVSLLQWSQDFWRTQPGPP
ncbi:MAG: hypothetical protein HXY36_02080 [Chloroflexi bacterium]|nr:hypothetical protein [Chloroflexota bacterium]